MDKAKEHLKMMDVFPFAVSFDSDGGIGAVVDSQGEYIVQAMENNYCSHMSNKDKNEYRNKVARYVAHSIASHDELVNQRNELLKALEAHEKFWTIRESELGELSPEAKAVRDTGLAVITKTKGNAA